MPFMFGLGQKLRLNRLKESPLQLVDGETEAQRALEVGLDHTVLAAKLALA